MKRIILILTIFLGLTSCSELLPCSGEFYIKSVEGYEGVDYYKYWAVAIDGRGSFFFIDKPNKYIIGDTIYIKKK